MGSSNSPSGMTQWRMMNSSNAARVAGDFIFNSLAGSAQQSHFIDASAKCTKSLFYQALLATYVLNSANKPRLKSKQCTQNVHKHTSKGTIAMANHHCQFMVES